MKSKVTRIAIYTYRDLDDVNVDVSRNDKSDHRYNAVTAKTIWRLSKLSYGKKIKTGFNYLGNRVSLFIRPIG